MHIFALIIIVLIFLTIESILKTIRALFFCIYDVFFVLISKNRILDEWEATIEYRVEKLNAITKQIGLPHIRFTFEESIRNAEKHLTPILELHGETVFGKEDEVKKIIDNAREAKKKVDEASREYELWEQRRVIFDKERTSFFHI